LEHGYAFRFTTLSIRTRITPFRAIQNLNAISRFSAIAYPTAKRAWKNFS
jgi:hypothetical protein